MDITVREISDRLARDCERVCQFLIPGGKPCKGEWICGDVSGSPGESLKIHIQGEHAGHWRDWASDSDHGDLIDLWRAVKGVSAPEAIRQAKQWLGITDSVQTAAERKYGPAVNNPNIKPLNPAGRACEFLTKKRLLEPGIVNRFKVSGDGKNLVFPCYGPDGRLINHSYRTLDEKKEVWQDPKAAPCLFGWHALDESAFKSRTVLLCEGQIDAMTWTQWGIPALSLPNGSGRTWIEYEWENLAAFDQIYVSFDMDGAGLENAEKVIHRLGKHRCLIVKLPEKDANDCLKAGHTTSEAREWVRLANPPAMKGLIRAADLEQRLLQALQPKKDCFTLPFLRNGSAGHGYFPRPCEVTVWTGVTSQGKSTFLNYFSMSALCIGKPVFIASMEAKAEENLKRMMSSFYSRIPTEYDIKEFLGEVGTNLVFADVVGYIEEAHLMEMMLFAHRRYGVEHCIIDSLMRINGLEEDYVRQGDFLNRLQEFVKQTGVHVHLVCHPRKGGSDDRKPGKMDVKGSSLIPNNADNIVVVCRNPEKDKLRRSGELTPEISAMMYDTEIIIEKQRETGWEGRFLLKFDSESFSYGPFTTTQPAAKPDKRTKE